MQIIHVLWLDDDSPGKYILVLWTKALPERCVHVILTAEVTIVHQDHGDLRIWERDQYNHFYHRRYIYFPWKDYLWLQDFILGMAQG